MGLTPRTLEQAWGLNLSDTGFLSWWVSMVERCDTILLAIAAIFAAGWLLGTLTAVPMQLARIGSVLAATPFVYDALFGNPPVPSDPAPRAAAALVWHALLVWAILDVLLL